MRSLCANTLWCHGSQTGVTPVLGRSGGAPGGVGAGRSPQKREPSPSPSGCRLLSPTVGGTEVAVGQGLLGQRPRRQSPPPRRWPCCTQEPVFCFPEQMGTPDTSFLLRLSAHSFCQRPPAPLSGRHSHPVSSYPAFTPACPVPHLPRRLESQSSSTGAAATPAQHPGESGPAAPLRPVRPPDGWFPKSSGDVMLLSRNL